MNYTIIDFAGLVLDTFLGESGQTYATLTSLADSLGIDRTTVKNWVQRYCKVQGVKVQVGKFKSMALAYPLDVLGEFMDYRISMGDKQALALYSATFRADLDRTIKEANGLIVTSKEHEEVRRVTRLELLKKWVDENYTPKRINGYGNYVMLTPEQMTAANLQGPIEHGLLYDLASIKKNEARMAEGNLSTEELLMLQMDNQKITDRVTRMAAQANLN